MTKRDNILLSSNFFNMAWIAPLSASFSGVTHSNLIPPASELPNADMISWKERATAADWR